MPPDAGAITALYTGLNTLDGFSTSGPIVSENGAGTGPLIQGRVDASTVSLGITGTMNLILAAQGTGAAPTTDGGVIRAHACLNCPGITMNLPDGGPVLLADGGVKPDTLAIVPDIPLTERTLYAAYITTDLKDTTNTNVIASPAFALVRSSAPLFDSGHSTVSLLTDAQAALLEPLRAALAPLFDALAAQGLPRSKLALGWAFSTETHGGGALAAPRHPLLATGSARSPRSRCGCRRFRRRPACRPPAWATGTSARSSTSSCSPARPEPSTPPRLPRRRCPS